MSFIVTSTGREQPVAPTSVANISIAGINIDEIAWSLSQVNRFTGHAARPYSVAEHSLLVCEIAERELKLNVHGQLAALMHDAHEAYTGDLHSPGKVAVGYGWSAWENSWARCVRTAFALHGPSHDFERAIKRADLMALATERRDLMPKTPTPWQVLKGIEPIGWVRLMSPERTAMHWTDWRNAFLDRYQELEYARNRLLFPTKA